MKCCSLLVDIVFHKAKTNVTKIIIYILIEDFGCLIEKYKSLIVVYIFPLIFFHFIATKYTCANQPPNGRYACYESLHTHTQATVLNAYNSIS